MVSEQIEISIYFNNKKNELRQFEPAWYRFQSHGGQFLVRRQPIPQPKHLLFKSSDYIILVYVWTIWININLKPIVGWMNCTISWPTQNGSGAETNPLGPWTQSSHGGCRRRPQICRGPLLWCFCFNVNGICSHQGSIFCDSWLNLDSLLFFLREINSPCSTRSQQKYNYIE